MKASLVLLEHKPGALDRAFEWSRSLTDLAVRLNEVHGRKAYRIEQPEG